MAIIPQYDNAENTTQQNKTQHPLSSPPQKQQIHFGLAREMSIFFGFCRTQSRIQVVRPPRGLVITGAEWKDTDGSVPHVCKFEVVQKTP